MVGFKQSKKFSNSERSQGRMLNFETKIDQWTKWRKALLFCMLTGLVVTSPGSILAAASCDYYASPSGGGSGFSETSPFKISDFWSVAGPGKTLCLLDGTYKGGSSMITPPENLSGKPDSPITVRALHDGKVSIDGEGVRQPVKLLYNNWFVLEGFNAHDSSYYVLELSHSDNTIVRRVVAWNAAIDKNNHVFGVPHSKFPLLEDVAGFGTGRKIFETYKTTNATIRRAWGRWEGSTQMGPKHTFAPVYNAYGTLIENSIGTWTAEQMTGGVDQPYDIFGVDRIDYEDQMSRTRLFGNISYVNGKGDFQPAKQLQVLKIGDVQIKDFVTFYPNSQYTTKRTALLLQCTTKGNAALCSNPKLSVTNFTNIGGLGPYIESHWQKVNVKSGSSVNEIYPPGETLFSNSGSRGATICKRYVDGVLTQEPLWPWPMDQRIYDALQQAGKTPFYVTNVIEDMFGTIPSECKKNENSGPDDPLVPPSGLQFTSK